jgi:hypothetical protein
MKSFHLIFNYKVLLMQPEVQFKNAPGNLL